MTRELKAGTVINVTNGNAKLLEKYYENGIFDKNEKGKIVISKNVTVEIDGNDFYYYDDNGKRHIIPEINSKSRDIEEEEEDVEEETDIDEGKEIDEDDDGEEEEYEYEEDEMKKKSDRRNNSRTKFDGKTYYYFPKPKTEEEPAIKIGQINKLYGNYSKVKSKDPLDNRILAGEDLKNFYNYLSKIDGIKIRENGKIDARNFQRDKEKVISGTYLTNSNGEKLYLSNSNTRAKILNNADDIVNQVTKMKSKTSGLHSNIPTKRCLRYIGNLGLAQILEKCRNFSYNDISSEEGGKLYKQVKDCLKFLNLEDNNDLHTKHNLVAAMEIWIDKVDSLKDELEKSGTDAFEAKYKEIFEAKYKEMSNSTSTNNLSSGTKRWIAV